LSADRVGSTAPPESFALDEKRYFLRVR
jgi:hypothetical protein